MTINKAQGGTLDVLGLEVTTSVFGHGQAYVALSRVSDFKIIAVLTPDGHPTARNVDFKSCLTRITSINPITVPAASTGGAHCY
jgi:hypothetical protein